MSEPSKAVFLSYASQDAEPAKKICDSLRAAGVEVWFDSDGGLEQGDEWDRKIRRQIKECVLFLPVISANTQARHEGYFRIEWELATERAMGIASGVPFLLPIVIDATREPDALVPDRFRKVQWTRIPGGEVTTDQRARFLKLWSHRTGVIAHEAAKTAGTKELPASMSAAESIGRPSAKVYALMAVGILAVVGAVGWWLLGGRKPAVIPATAVTVEPMAPAPVAPVSEARRLAAKAHALIETLDSTRDDYKLAGELLEQAKAKDPTDAEIWAADAQLNWRYLVRGWDFSDGRREAARAATQRALRLDPQSFEARFAQAAMLSYTGREGVEKERLLRELRRERPADHRVLRELGEDIERQDRTRTDEAAAIFDEAAALPGGDPLALYNKSMAYWFAGRPAEADAAMDAALAQRVFTGALLLKVWYAIIVHGDLAGAQATLDRIPPADMMADRASFFAFYLHFLKREPDAALAGLSALPRDWLTDNWYTGPKGRLIGDALQLGGRAEAAAVEWHAALKLVEARLLADSTNSVLRLNRLILTAELGEREEAARQFAVELQADGIDLTRDAAVAAWVTHVCILLGRKEEAIRQLALGLQRQRRAVEYTAARLRLDPLFDPLRGDPAFQKVVADAEAIEKPAEPKRETASAATLSPPDQKSVAVLAFANLSDDKGNEYFSDGISEELLNVLAKVPGLKVAARTSSFHFKGKDTAIPEIARQLGVAYVVEGSVRRAANQVRITAQLIKAADGFHVWSDTFTRDLKDIFVVQDEIAGLVAKALELKMGVDQPNRREVNPEAFRLLLSGRAKVRLSGNANRDAGIADFRAAVALAPDYAEPWAEMAHAYVQNARFGGVALETGFREARAAAEKALALAPDSAAVLANVGWVRRTADWDWRGADQAFHRAVQLSPDNADILTEASVTLLNVGHADEAIQLGRRAVTLDPLNPEAHFNLSYILSNEGRTQESVESARRAVALAPGAEDYHSNLAAALIDVGQLDEAARELALEMHGDLRITTEALIMVRRGQKAGARVKIHELEGLPNRNNDMAELYAENGDIDLAFAALEKSYALHETGMAWVKADYYLKPLHSDPRWPGFLRKMGLADDQLK